MGLFSKKKTYVNSSITPLLEDTPDVITDSVYYSIVADRPVANDLVANILGCAASRANGYFTRAKKSYYYGLPEGTKQLAKPNEQLLVKQLSELNEDKPVQLEYYVVSTLDPDYVAYEWLAENRDFDYYTLTLGNPPPINNATDITYVYSVVASPTELDLTYSYRDQFGKLKYFTERVIVNTVYGTLDSLANYYHVGYVLLDSQLNPDGPIQFFNYRENTGMFPVLKLPEVVEEASEYFPVVPVCLKGKNLAERPVDENSEEYKIWRSCRQQLLALGVKYEDLGKALFGPFDDDVDESEKPDPKDLDYGFVIMGANMANDAQGVLAYYHEYFKYLAQNSVYTLQDYLSWEAKGSKGTPPSNKITIKEQQYNIDFEYYYTNFYRETGNLGIPVGEYTQTTDFQEEQTNNQGIFLRKDKLIIKKQVTETSIEVTEIFNPFYTNYVEGRHRIEVDLREAFAPEDKALAFVIPLNHRIANRLPILTYNELIYQSLQLVINTITTVKLKWYQTFWGKLFSFVVIAIVTVVTMNPAAMANMSAFIGATVYAMAISAVTSFVISIGAKLVLDVLGIDNAFLATLLIAAVMLATGSYFGNSLKLSTIDGLMASTNSISKSAQIVISHKQEQMFEEHKEFMSGINEEIDEINDLLEQFKPNVSTEVILQSTQVGANYITQESPSEFIARTINPNPGVLSLREIESFVDRALNIPGVSPLNSLS